MQMPFSIALAVASCLFGIELFGIVSLLKKITLYKRRQAQKEKELFSLLPGIFLPGGMTGPNLFLAILIVLVLAGAMVWICLAEYWRILNESVEKEISDLAGKREKLSKAIPEEEDDPIVSSAFASWKEQEDVLPLSKVAADEPTEPSTEEIAVQAKPPVKPKHIPPIPLSGDDEDSDEDLDPEELEEMEASGELDDVYDPVDDPNVFLGDERIIGYNAQTGCNIVAHYRKSFEAKLIQSKRNVKHYYSELKNELLSYEGNKSRLSWTADSFHNGRNAVAKINVKTRVLELYLALNPAELEGTVYRGKDVSKMKKYADTPFQYKIRTERKFRWAMELVEKACEKLDLNKALRIPEDFEAKYAFDNIEHLVKRGLVKEYIREEPLEGAQPMPATEAADASFAEVLPAQAIPTASPTASLAPEDPSRKEEEEPAEELYTPLPESKARFSNPSVFVPQYEQKSLDWDLIPSAKELSEMKKREEEELFEREELQNFRTRFEEDMSRPKEPAEKENATLNEIERKPYVPFFEKSEQKEPTELRTPSVIKTLAADPEKENREEKGSQPAVERKESLQEAEPTEAPAEFSEPPEEAERAEASEPQARISEPGIAMLDIRSVESDFEKGALINLRSLKAKGKIPNGTVQLKVFTTGNLTKAFTVEANKFTMEAILAIHSAGGETVVVLS